MIKNLKHTLFAMVMTMISLTMLMSISHAQWDRFQESLNDSSELIQNRLDRNGLTTADYLAPKWEWVKNLVYDVVDKFLIPLLIVASILVVILWLYKIMVSGKDEIEKWSQYVIYGVLWVVLLRWAKFITDVYIGIIDEVAPSDNSAPSLSFTELAQDIYTQLLVPFINIFTYILIGVLFVILLIHVMRFITSSDEDVTVKAKSIMISNIVGIVVILLAKTMVEAIYGKQAQVVDTATDLGQIWQWILAGADFTVVFTIINYVLWFLWLIILIVIVIQTYQVLINPTNEDLIKKTKTNLLYIVIWLGMIALSYVIVNFIIIT